MNIPISFELGGTTFNVIYTDNVIETGEVGYCSMPKSSIIISNTFRGCNCTDDYKEATFYHELVHCLLLTKGEDKLSSDESFVEGLANLLHQFMKSAKYV